MANFVYVIIFMSLAITCSNAGNLTGNPALLEANNGNVRIHTSIIFTCTLQWKPGTSPLLMAMNFMYDEGTICAAYETAGTKLSYLSICNGRSTLTKVSDTVYRLEITDAALTDQKQFYCKPYETFSSQEESIRIPITVQVPPQEPIITLSNTSTLVANNNTALTLTCVANTGKLRGSLTWYQTMMDAQDQMMPEVKFNSETSVYMPQANGTVVVRDTVVITALSEAYNGARYRCAATNPILGPTEEGPSAQANLDVQYAVKSLTIVTNGEQWTGSRVIQTTTTISCTAKGNPTPTYSWIQVSGPGTPTATGGTLLANLSDTPGNYSYMCNASNTVAGQPTQQSITINFEIRDVNSTDVKFSCDGGDLQLTCSVDNVLNVISARYGRNGRQYCNKEPIQQLYCESITSYNIVREICQDQQSCVVEASNVLFCDPCVGTVKYLEVYYQCVQATDTVVTECEGGSVTLNCPVRTGIEISSANYGRTGRYTCNINPIVTLQCWASNSMAEMNNRCNGKRTCTVAASNTVFGDPCVGTVKYLQVRYHCVFK